MKMFIVGFICLFGMVNCDEPVSMDLTNLTGNDTQVCCQLNGQHVRLDCVTPNGNSLDLSYKGLNQLPFCRASKLTEAIETLDLDRNNISDYDFDQIFYSFPNINTLLMWNNNLLALNGTKLKRKNTLLYMDLGRNQIQRIEAGFFASFTHLKELKLENNRLTALPIGAFKGMKSLRRIDLSFNKIKVFTLDWFDKNTTLTSIHVAGNQISSWVPFNFKWPKTMKRLNFSVNHLPAVLPLPMFDNNTAWSVDLTKNELTCDCRHPEHSKQIVNTKVACNLHLDCQEFVQKRRNKKSPEMCTTEQDDGRMLWLSQFVKKPVCSPPKVTGYKQKLSHREGYQISCRAIGFPLPDVHIRAGIYKYSMHNENSVNMSKNVLLEVIVNEKDADNVTCEAVNIFGSDIAVVDEQHLNDSVYYKGMQNCQYKQLGWNNNTLFYITAVSSSLSLLLALFICIYNVHGLR